MQPVWFFLLLPLPSVVAAAAPARSFSVTRAFLEGGMIGKLVLAALLLMSIASWAVILGKVLMFRRVAHHNRRFLEVFRKSARFSEINNAAHHHAASPLVGVFQAGYVEIDAQVKTSRESQAAGQHRIRSLEGVERSLRRARGIELDLLAKNSAILATTAAAAPFIGLFGTVWGIMIAFHDIGASGSASIVTVAPGIAESLINTAAGLFAAIPALIGYNHIASRLRTVRSELDDFTLEFLNLAERNFL